MTRPSRCSARTRPPRLAAPRIAAGEKVALLFGRERNGLENDEVGLADAILTLPVNPAFASLNLAQAVVIVGYEWFKLSSAGGLPFATPEKSPPAPKEQLLAFFADLERELERIEYFRPHEKRGTMTVNMRNIFTRMQPSQQDIRTLHGIVMALVEGRKGPARGGLLDGPEAEMLRNLLAQHGKAEIVRSDSPVRGLARLLRRNPTDAERAALDRDDRGPALRRRSASSGRRRSARMLRISCRSRCGWWSTLSRTARIPRRPTRERRSLSGCARAIIGSFEVGAGEVTRDVNEVLDRVLAVVGHAPPDGNTT